MPALFRLPAVLAYGATLLLCTPVSAQAPATNAAPASTNAAAASVDPSSRMVAQAIGLANANKFDEALDRLNKAIQLNPKNPGAYVLRASLYCQQKKWDLAEADFKTAAQLSPGNVVLKFNIIEVKFMQKQYDAARPGYVALENDPDMGDFASYKVFLCDLAGGHMDAAKKDLDAFDKVGGNPSYYFANAAWSIVHKNYADAKSWLESAIRIYDPRKNSYYAESLIYLGYLPLPGDVPGSATNAPSATP